MSNAAATKAPPAIRTVIDTHRVRPAPSRPVWLMVACGWCGTNTTEAAASCMVCLPHVRRLAAVQQHPEWLAFCAAMVEDLACKDVAADWLEEHELPEAAAHLRSLGVTDCPSCKGTGRVRNRWKTVWPHDGEPCRAAWCVRGKALKEPEVTPC